MLTIFKIIISIITFIIAGYIVLSFDSFLTQGLTFVVVGIIFYALFARYNTDDNKDKEKDKDKNKQT